MAGTSCRVHIDFEDWSALARRDPAQFEARRNQVIEAFIQGAPMEKRARLRGLQWQIDQVRALSGSPLGACVRISRMMWDSLSGDDGLIDSLEHLGSADAHTLHNTSSAKVLPFRTPHRKS